MNPITLNFSSEKIAKLYDQQEQYNILQYNAYLIISGMTIVLGSAYVVSNIDSIRSLPTLITLLITIYAMISIATICRFKKLTNAALFFFNLFFSFNLFELPPAYDPYIGVLIGASQMSIHTSLLFMMKFRWSLVSNFLIFSIFLINASLRSNLKIFQYIFVILISLAFTIFLYIFERTKRERFLLTQKENIIENIIPKFIKKPFFIFRYDDVKCELDIILKRYLEKNQKFNLEYLLQNIWYKKQQLKKYVYEQISEIQKTNQTKKKQYLDVLFRDQKHIVKFEYYQQYYMISLDTKQELIVKLRNRHKIGIQKMQKYIISVLSTLSRLVCYDQEITIKLKFTINQLINYIKMINTNKSVNLIDKSQVNANIQINLFTEFQKIVSYLKFKAKKKVNLEGDSDLMVEYPQKLFQIFLFELFKLFKFQNTLNIRIYRQEQIIIKLNGINQTMQKSKIFKDLSNMFIDHTFYHKNGIQIVLKDEIDLPFQQIGIIES